MVSPEKLPFFKLPTGRRGIGSRWLVKGTFRDEKGDRSVQCLAAWPPLSKAAVRGMVRALGLGKVVFSRES